ncbi:DNA recombination protein RmuC [Planctobacterium marinum]|uniref:DNA recombination protein RmuC n=1 Tax=Planctobacterium marinum TaxID=1631968 RepID=A0AA48HV76_9ALTE|nr:DNA recombination protein RmuC [Planctobacterium marinum]
MINDPLVWTILAALVSAVLVFVILKLRYNAQLSLAHQAQSTHQLQLQTLQEQAAFLKQQEQSSREQLNQVKVQNEQLNRQLIEQSEVLGQFKMRNARMEQQLQQLAAIEEENEELEEQLDNLKNSFSETRNQLEAEKTAREHENKAAQEKLDMLKNAEQQLQKQFENLANQIFKTHSNEFEKSSQQKLALLLDPLKQQIEGFRSQVSQQAIREGQERASLKTEIINLQQLNKKITEEASALTRALKGDNKKQGNWGEMVLQKILEESGLREGHEYDTQVSKRREDGKLLQPDILVHLPEQKEVIIDSKVSLNAYERFYNAHSEIEQARHLKEHILSVKTHIKELGRKEYHELLGDKSLEYVLMFIPVEGAFMLALDESPELVKLAMDNNVLLVSPTNLLVALRTIHNIWQYEYQNQNAREIAKKAADLYDKFYGFVVDMEKLGDAINTVQKRFSDANSKLYEGRGNLVKKAEEFQALGVQPSKKLTETMLKNADM